MNKTKVLIGASGASSVLNLHQWILHFRIAMNCEIKVIVTKQASRMIQTDLIAHYAGSVPFIDFFPSNEFPAPHVSLSQWADVLLVLPASANIIAKAANGIADDLLTSAILAATIPVIFVPSMNEQMWCKPSVQRNIKQLDDDGFHVIKPQLSRGYCLSRGTFEMGINPDIPIVSHVIKRILDQTNLENCSTS